MKKSITYFEKAGIDNTDNLIEVVKERQEELDIKTILVASNTGNTALKVSDELNNVNIVSITHHAGFREKGKLETDPNVAKQLEERGIIIYAGSHALSGVGRGISNKFGGVTPVEIIAQTLRMFSQGIKVCVEISIMAADAGLVPVDEEIIVIGGTANGADTAVILKPVNMSAIFDLRINEIIAMPRP